MTQQLENRPPVAAEQVQARLPGLKALRHSEMSQTGAKANQGKNLEELFWRLRGVHQSIASIEVEECAICGLGTESEETIDVGACIICRLGRESREVKRSITTGRWIILTTVWTLIYTASPYLAAKTWVVVQSLQPQFSEMLSQLSLFERHQQVAVWSVTLSFLALTACVTLPSIFERATRNAKVDRLSKRVLPAASIGSLKIDIRRRAYIKFVLATYYLLIGATMLALYGGIPLEEPTRSLVVTIWLLVIPVLSVAMLFLRFFLRKALFSFQTDRRIASNGLICVEILGLIDRLDVVRGTSNNKAFHLSRDEKHKLRGSIAHVAFLIESLHDRRPSRDANGKASRDLHRKLAKDFESLIASIDHPTRDNQKELEETLCKYLNSVVTGYWDGFKDRIREVTDLTQSEARQFGRVKNAIYFLAVLAYMIVPFILVPVLGTVFKLDVSVTSQTSVCLVWMILGLLFFPSKLNPDVNTLLVELVKSWLSKK